MQRNGNTLSPRDEKLLQFINAFGEFLMNQNETSQAVIDYNIMMGKLDDPTREEN